MELSIITPYYNTLEYTKRLASILEPQLTDKIEWIIVDDGCDELELDKLNAKIIHLPTNSGCASKPRNVGLDNAKGRYITFIDSDDMVSDDYIETILNNLKNDIIFISWKSDKHNVIINRFPPKWNCSVWSRVYKRSIIGNIRFREDLRIAEDWVFNKEIKFKTYASIHKQIYFYTIRENSLIRSSK